MEEKKGKRAVDVVVFHVQVKTPKQNQKYKQFGD